MDEKQRVWNSVLGEIELNISKPQFNTWIKNTYPISMDEHEIVICVPSSFTREWLQNKFNTTIANSIQKITGKMKYVRYVIQEQSVAEQQKDNIKAVINLKDKQFQKQYTPEDPESDAHLSGSDMNPLHSTRSTERGMIKVDYTFDNFIVGSSNALAHAAAQSVAHNLGEQYNPLFIYGGVGLGKTHLIQAVANEVSQQGKNVVYTTSDAFISDLMKSIEKKEMESFKKRYKSIDLLIIDDIQFIRGKEGTQYEIFNTFNELYSHSKQIIFTSDRPPSSIQQLSDRLKSRFEGGMIVDIALPEFETRVAILQSKCEQKEVEIDEEILRIIAEKIKSNVRELEGALNKIIARIQLLGSEITPKVVSNLIEGGQIHSKRILTEDVIINGVVDYFDITREEILSKTRRKDISYPRQILMYLLREELDLTYPTIGSVLGGRDHSTVMHAHTKIKETLEYDAPLEQEIRTLRNRLYNEEDL